MGQQIASHSTALPTLQPATVAAYTAAPLAFEELYKKFQSADPTAAEWLRDATEVLAPANPAEKEKYASVVLAFYEMLQRQAAANKQNA